MKKFALLALAASAAIATPAAAQTVTGTINLTGSVAPKCFVVPGNGSTFGSTVAFGELAVADGTLRTDLATAFGTQSFSVLCTTANPTISVDSTALATAAPSATGYDNSIDFNATVTLTTVSANAGPFSNDSSAAPLAATAVGSRLSNGSGNINITTSNYRTGALSDLLVASPTYTGSIVVVIAPGA
jgi:hypothetical protein